MADPVDELIREIAARHGIAVSRDDPILVLHTINARLLRQTADAQQAQLDRHKEELEALALRWGSDGRALAEKALNAALAAGRTAMLELMQEGARTMAAGVQTEIDAALAQLAGPMRDARRIVALNVAAACIALLAAALAFWTVR